MGISDRRVLAAFPGRIVTARLRSDHRIVILYFLYTALLAWRFSAPPLHLAVASLAPLFLFFWFFHLEQLPGRLRDFASDWLPMALILFAYRQLELFTTPFTVPWQATWLQWDRWLLYAFGLQSGIESAGGLFPELLQAVYLSLYALPVLSLAAVYGNGARTQADRFLHTLFAGTLLVYALIPHFPTDSPRQLFPGADEPHYQGLLYAINVWLLDHADITTGVFPSGHVAVAFSCALGLRRVLPARCAVVRAAFAVAAAVYLATIYGRFHYAVDGAASIVLCLLVDQVLEATHARS